MYFLMLESINIAKTYSELPPNIINALYHKDVFVSSAYVNFKVKESKIYIVYNADYLIIIRINKKLLFKYCDFISGVVKLSHISNSLYKDFLENSILLIKKKFRVQWISTTPNYAIFEEYPSKSQRIPFGTYIIDLQSNTEDELFTKIHPKHRNSIKRAEKNGIEVRFGLDLIHDYLLLDSFTNTRRGNSKTDNQKKIIDMITRIPKICFLAVAYKDGVPQGGALLFYNKLKCYYMYGASRDNPEPGSMNLLHWKCIQYMKEKSVQEYDFVGARINEDENSKYHGIQNFKKRFGGELIQGYIFKVVINNFMYKLYKILLLIKVHNNKDIIDQEIHKWTTLNSNS